MKNQRGFCCRKTTGKITGCVRFHAGRLNFKVYVPTCHVEVPGRMDRIYFYVKLYEQKLREPEGPAVRSLNNKELKLPDRALRELPDGFQDLSESKKKETLKDIFVQLAIEDEQVQLENFVPGVGSQSTSNRSLPHEIAHEPFLDIAGKQSDLAGGHAFDEAQRHPVTMAVEGVLDRVRRALQQFEFVYTSKIEEMQDLKRKVAGINDGTRIIPLPKCGSEKFQECLAYLKQIVTKDEKLLWLLKNCEQDYVAYEAECEKLRKVLDDHNSKVTYDDLLHAPNTSCVRVTEPLRFPEVPGQNCGADELPEAACRSNDVPCGDEDDFLMAGDMTIVNIPDSILPDTFQNNPNFTEDVGVSDCYRGEMQNDGGSTLHVAPEAMLKRSHRVGNNSSEDVVSVLLDSVGDAMPCHMAYATMEINSTSQLVALNQHHSAGSDISKPLDSVSSPTGHLDSRKGLKRYEKSNNNDVIYEPSSSRVPLFQNPHIPSVGTLLVSWAPAPN